MARWSKPFLKKGKIVRKNKQLADIRAGRLAMGDLRPEGEIAWLFGMTQDELRALRRYGAGPPWHGFSGHIYYNIHQFRIWLHSKRNG